MTDNGLPASVYRNPRGDFTLGGISGAHDELTIMNASGPFPPRDDRPAVLVLPGPGFGHPTVFPAARDDRGEWVKAPGSWSFGGNYLATSDSRFREVCPFYGALAIHDRDMNKERRHDHND